jgi:exopolysaccharide biosynthesis protein
MFQLTRQISHNVWVRPCAYLLLVSLIGSSTYIQHSLAKEEQAQQIALAATLETSRLQTEAYKAKNQLNQIKVRLQQIGGDTTTLDQQIATVTSLLTEAKFQEVLDLARTAELAAASTLETTLQDQAAAEELALKSGSLSLSITNGAEAVVLVKQDVTTISTLTADASGKLTAVLPVGSYKLEVQRTGFTPITTDTLTILGKETTTLALNLVAIATPTPTAKVTARATSTPKATSTPTSVSSSTANSSYRRTTISSSRGSYTADIMEFQLGAGKIKVIADTAADYDCNADCPTMAVKSYVQRHAGAVAGINGTYFCAADYSSCSAEKGKFFWKIYNTRLNRMMNPSNYLGEEDPFLIFDSVGNPTFLSTWSSLGSRSIAAGINHKPAVVRNGSYSVDEGALDDKQRTAKVSRAALGLKGSTLYVVIVQAATVMDLGAVMVAMGVDNALNIDAGGSSAMYYNGEYKRGPGRGVPNALVFVEQ